MFGLRLLSLGFLLTTLILGGCAAGSGGGGSSAARANDTGGGRLSNEGLDMNAEAVHNPVRDARVILYQPVNRTMLILVNHNHSLRETLEGRQRLALGLRGQGYKVLSDLQMDSLIESYTEKGCDVIREPASRSDYQWLKATRSTHPDFKGIILVENNGQAWKYMGVKPHGDPLKAQRYQHYTDAKGLTAVWHSANSQIELPSPAMRGGSDPSQFDVAPSPRQPGR